MSPRALGLLIAVAALLAPSTAAADSVTITAPPDVPMRTDVALSFGVATAQEEAHVTVVRRPVTAPACDPTANGDRERNGAWYQSGSIVAFQRVSATTGTVSVTTTFEDPGRYRLCAWLHQFGGGTLAAATAEVEVRGATGTLRIDGLRQGRTGTTLTELTAKVSGTASAATNVYAILVPADRMCPTADLAAPDWERMRATTEGPFGPGPFTIGLVTERPVPHGNWRLCVAMSSSPALDDASAAAATATVETGFAPRYSIEHRPRIVHARKPILRCVRGKWIALPDKIRFSVIWKRNGRRVRGADGWRLRSRGYATYRCIVTARNRFGATRVPSPPDRLRPYFTW